MAYTCPTCTGTGLVAGAVCPRCLGNKTLIEDSQGITVSFDGTAMGQLRSVSVQSASVSVEDVTAMNATLVNFGAGLSGLPTTVAVRQLMPGDLTPGEMRMAWIGKTAFAPAALGKIVIIVFRSVRLGEKTYRGFLVSYESQYDAGEIAGGTATIQLVEV